MDSTPAAAAKVTVETIIAGANNMESDMAFIKTKPEKEPATKPTGMLVYQRHKIKARSLNVNGKMNSKKANKPP
jgi:hypothetical protein